jgi:hypothetical protein
MNQAAPPKPQGMAMALEIWSRKVHDYLGLYFLLFLWLFALSGLLLNHPGGPGSDFWASRKQEQLERPVRLDAAGTDLERARQVMAQLGIGGEIEWTVARQAGGHFRFRVARPGRMYEIDVDQASSRAAVAQTTVNGWGVLNALHHFNGVHMGDARNSRDWWLTDLWTFSMDALSAGLILLLLSGIYIWFRSGRRRLAGLAALTLGLASAGFFLIALR